MTVAGALLWTSLCTECFLRASLTLHKSLGLNSAVQSISQYGASAPACKAVSLGSEMHRQARPGSCPLSVLVQHEPRMGSLYPTSQIGKLRLRRVKELAQGHTASKPI